MIGLSVLDYESVLQGNISWLITLEYEFSVPDGTSKKSSQPDGFMLALWVIHTRMSVSMYNDGMNIAMYCTVVGCAVKARLVQLHLLYINHAPSEPVQLHHQRWLCLLSSNNFH